jgi:hypothetical protein
MKNKRVNNSISLTNETWETLSDISAKSGISRSTLIEISLFNFLQLKPNGKGKLVVMHKDLKKLLFTSYKQPLKTKKNEQQSNDSES